jgi:serine/threonine protein kinase
MLPPAVTERFEIGARLGAGSFGVVYEAFDLVRNRPVAIKVLERVAADTVARFKREFRYLAELRHPNLASMYELVVLGGEWILIMERIDGTELLEHLAGIELQQSFVNARIPTERVIDLDATMDIRAQDGAHSSVSRLYIDQVRESFRQLAGAIAVLHAFGVLHRDIKPSNIMITGEGRVVLLDFGLVIPQSYDDSIDRKTVVGTPGFMSPEQVTASKVTPATDWYSFGALLFQALTGQLPFRGGTALEVIERQMKEEPRRAADVVAGIPDDLSSLAYDCLQREAERRPGGGDVLERIGLPRFDPKRLERSRERSTVLIGRGRELRRLRGYIDSAQRGHGRLVLLHGSPGSGKSALVDHLLDDARAAGNALILGGRCSVWESVPFNAIDAIVDSLTRELRRERQEEVEQIMRTALSVTQLFPVLAAAAPADVGDERISVPTSGQRLMARASAELRSILFATARGRPIVMLLDDAQWGDYKSAQVFQRLLEREDGPPMVLILCYRSEDWKTSLLLQGLSGAGVDRREVHLKELSRAMTYKLVKRRHGRGGRRLVDRVFRQGGGNPLLTEMIVDVLKSSPDDALLARSFNSRLERLSAPARLLFASLFSSEDPVPEEIAESTLELFEIDEPVRTLSNEKLIRLRRTGDLRELDIYHPRMRDVLYDVERFSGSRKS